jgi:hypothetical protein
MSRVVGMTIVLAVFVVACTGPDRMTVEDIAGQSFESTLEALEHAGCPFVVYSEGLIGSPPLLSATVLEMALDAPTGWNQFYGKVDRVVEFAPGLWLFVADDGLVVGGIDEKAYVKAFCEPDDQRTNAVSP